MVIYTIRKLCKSILLFRHLLFGDVDDWDNKNFKYLNNDVLDEVPSYVLVSKEI